MLKKVEEFIKINKMISPGDRVVAGVSGGADSVCLLDVLNHLSGKIGFTLSVIHVNHMIRGEEAERDEEYVKKLCQSYQIPLFCVHRDVTKLAGERGISLEEAGRQVRYEAFDSIVESDKIAVAHHGNDQAETVLYHIIRGSSVKGAGGMKPVRDKIIRPLLCVSRQEIEVYLEKRNIDFCTDSTNLTVDYTRNKLRNIVLPFLKENINPDVVSNINELALDLQESYDYIHSQAESVFQDCRINESGISIKTNRLMKEPSVIQREVIMMMVKEAAGTVKDITRKHISAAADLLYKPVSKKVNLPYGLTAVRGYEELILRNGYADGCNESYFMKCREEDFDFQILESVDSWEKITNDYTKVFDYDKIKGNLKIRKRMAGDYITLDCAGSKKLLKAYFIDEKIPREERSKIWVLAEDSHILWIVGYRISAAYKVSPETKRILKVTIRRKENGI